MSVASVALTWLGCSLRLFSSTTTKTENVFFKRGTFLFSGHKLWHKMCVLATAESVAPTQLSCYSTPTSRWGLFSDIPPPKSVAPKTVNSLPVLKPFRYMWIQNIHFQRFDKNILNLFRFNYLWILTRKCAGLGRVIPNARWARISSGKSLSPWWKNDYHTEHPFRCFR